MEKADALVAKALEVITYLAPEKWWLETPRNGLLPKRRVVKGPPFVDVDYCRFEDCGYQKPTRFFGSGHVRTLEPVLCNGRVCPSLQNAPPRKEGLRFPHRWHKGGTGRVHREMAYVIPQGVVEYVSGLAPAPLPWSRVNSVGSAEAQAPVVEEAKPKGSISSSRLWRKFGPGSSKSELHQANFR